MVTTTTIVIEQVSHLPEYEREGGMADGGGSGGK